VGQYDSWFGEAGQFWSKDGLALPGLRIRCTGALAVKGQRVDVTFAYELENLAASPIDDLAVEVFVPLKVFLDAGETTLLEAAEIAASPNVTTSQTTRADGLGRAASGVAGGYFGGTLAKGGKVRFHLRVSARLKAKGIVWPLLSVRGRALSERVWPETQIRLAEPVNTGRFAYLSYNLVVPDSRVLDLRRAGAAFLPATTMTRSGAR
jgi:hypothetical protein